jgi:ADP-ribosylglycohydrolase
MEPFDNKERREHEPNDPIVSNCNKTRTTCPELKYLSCSNTEILRALFDEGLVNAVEWEELYSRPEPKVSRVEAADKVVNMLLGVAIGDSLGYPVEHLIPEERLKRYGLITSYISGRALPSDDTQLTFDTVKVILEHGRIVPWELARIFASHRISGMGKTVREFLRNYRERGLPWYRTGLKRPSNGAIMRISPVIIPNLKTKENYLVDAVLDTLITHNEPLAIASSVAFADMLWNVINSNGRIDVEWIIERFVIVISKLTGDKKYKTREIARVRYEGPASEFIRDQIYYALDKGLTVQELSKTIGSGGYLLETVTNALFIFVKYLDDPQRGIIEAVNFTKDNDTIASIVASAFGALYGRQAFRKDWIKHLPGKLLKHGQDGEVFQLLNCIEAFLTS